MNNSLAFRRVAAMCCAILSLTGCSLFSEDRDRVLAGSLTLTPLRIPKDLTAPDSRNAMHIPEQTGYSEMKSSELEKPPILDTELANELEKKLASNVSKTPVQTFQVTLAQAAGNHSELVVKSDFDVLWQHMENVLEQLGFDVTDRDRSQHRYYVNRKLPMSREELKQIETTGEGRTSGGNETYQIEVTPESNGEQVKIKVRNERGQLDNSGIGRHLLVQIKAYLEQPLQ